MHLLSRLKELLHIGENADVDEIQEAFKQIADILIKDMCIKRGDRVYYIEEIEFYYYNKNHRDLITYPRNTRPLQWYRNAFCGVDITFASECRKIKEGDYECYDLNSDPSFGGILIRKLSLGGKIIDGPRKCADALFDVLDAISTEGYPLLSELKESRCVKVADPLSRINILPKNKTAEEKVESIVYNNYIAGKATESMVKDFQIFVEMPFRFYAQNL